MKKIKLAATILCLVIFITGCGKSSSLKQSYDNKTDKNVVADGTTNITNEDYKVSAGNDEKSSIINTIDEKNENTTGSTNTVANTNTNKSTGYANTTKPGGTEVKSSGKTIVIDPGHANRSNLDKEPIAPGSSELKIKDGGGAQGVATRTPEYLVNMQVSLKLKALLEQKGYKVVMTKTDNSQSLGNVERAEIGNKANAALVIRIHADSSGSASAKGASMLVPASINSNAKGIYSESKRCGAVVLNRLIKEVGMQNRGVVERNDMTGFNWSTVPVILVEMGFLSNPDEDKLLSASSYQTKLAQGLADGIAEAIK